MVTLVGLRDTWLTHGASGRLLVLARSKTASPAPASFTGYTLTGVSRAGCKSSRVTCCQHPRSTTKGSLSGKLMMQRCTGAPWGSETATQIVMLVADRSTCLTVGALAGVLVSNVRNELRGPSSTEFTAETLIGSFWDGARSDSVVLQRPSAASASAQQTSVSTSSPCQMRHRSTCLCSGHPSIICQRNDALELVREVCTTFTGLFGRKHVHARIVELGPSPSALTADML
mmetsp:Transcript_5536/g.10381  ORF Transcript_5536/g.10381 Transcript_5536/m.10381 type:complete len:230 (-) Transcript_5536:884-1573(-)